MNAVSTINKIEIPSTPSLNFINPLIQFFLLKIENQLYFYQNEYHKKKTSNKFAIEVNIEI